MSVSNIRNFCIIAHIDHGKSTLADRFLEFTETIEKRKMRDQLLDTMSLERERGITIKMQPVRMVYKMNGIEYILNLIDTPGHADFSYEVSRSLAAVEGAILLVDASQGVQAQTIYNLEEAKKQGLVVVPVINKIDLPHANIPESKKEIVSLLGCGENDVLEVSAKTGAGVEKLIEAIIKKVPPPNILTFNVNDINNTKASRALIFDSQYNQYKGTLAFVRVFNGNIKIGNKIKFLAQNITAEVESVGYFKPFLEEAKILNEGEIGYIFSGIKEIENIRVGDTIAGLGFSDSADEKIKPLPGYKEPQSVVFAGLYAQEDDFKDLRVALAKLKLNDASLKYEFEQSEILGRGFRCGFLGMLHLDIVKERLIREYGVSPLVTSPSVFYRIFLTNGDEKVIYSPSDLPDMSLVEKIEEPWIDLEIVSPSLFIGRILGILKNIRAVFQDTQYLNPQKVLIRAQAPLSEIIIDFYDKLKNASQGYASMGYELSGYRAGDLARLDIIIAGEKENAFSRILHKQKIQSEGRRVVEKLKELIPRQLFSVSLQAAVGGKIIAREDISALRKDVTGYLYGGDYSRKRKLLEKQKKGKKKMKQLGRVQIPPDVYINMLKK